MALKCVRYLLLLQRYRAAQDVYSHAGSLLIGPYKSCQDCAVRSLARQPAGEMQLANH
jgi:hypothetical protein